MNDLYLSTSLAQSKIVTENYSSSFSRSLRLIDPSLRPAMYALYGMVRIADEIVDQHWDGVDPVAELDAFEKAVFAAIESKYSSNPILYAFQWAVHTYDLSHDHIRAFMHSMRMDTSSQTYTAELYTTYIYGSADVIGLLSLQIFSNGDTALYEKLAPGAQALGSAFQKVNFLRDLYADCEERGRIYFPGVARLPLTLAKKTEIEADIRKDFVVASSYVRSLPPQARKAVSLAYSYYERLFAELVRCSPEELRVRHSVSKAAKAWLFITAALFA